MSQHTELIARLRGLTGTLKSGAWSTIAEAADALQAMERVPMTWQPIETAPKDVLVLVYTPPQPEDWPDTVNITFDYICQDYEDWHNHCEAREHYMMVGGSNACGPDVVCTGPGEKAPYTHWHPLPTPPESKG